MNKTALQEITGILCRPNPKQIIILLTVFFLIYSVLGSATGNTSGTEEDPVFWDFGSLTITDSNNDPLFCTVTLYNKDDGILNISNFTATLNIEKINSGSQLYIESKEKNLSLDFSIDGDSSDPVVRIENYGGSNPVEDYDPPGSSLTYVSVDAVNLSYGSVRLAVDCHDVDETIDISSLKIFKYDETFNEWVELPTRIDDKAVSADLDSLSVFAVSVIGDTDNSKNLSVGTVSVLDSIGGALPAGIKLAGPEGTLAEAVGTLTVDEVPQGSHLIINSTQKNIMLDFTLDGDAQNPVILLEDFGDENPAGDYLPPAEPVKYLMFNAENLSYSGVNLTIHYPAISGNIALFRVAGTSANDWEELTAFVDLTNNTISTTLDSVSIIALCEKPLRVIDSKNVPLTVSIQTYDHNKVLQQSRRGHTLSIDTLPEPAYLKIDALANKSVAVTFKSANSSGGEVVLDDFGRHNPVNLNPDRAPVKFVEIHARNMKFDSAEIEIQYSNEEIGLLDETKLQISHYSNGAWVTLNSTVDTKNNTVSATTSSLSTFALIYNGTSVNTRKSIYQPGEMAEIVIVVLDSAGAPVSDASIRMNVTVPNGSTEYFSTLTSNIAETSDPGVYEATYLTTIEGQYNISCTAIIEGNESRFDTYFMVQSEYDFDIIRHAQSKIDPTKYDTFDVTIDIISYTDADTITVWEYVPANFEVYTDADVHVKADNLQVLKWQRSLLDNRTSVNYSYSVPMEWPKLYQLGPLEIDYGERTFAEARPWYVAVDPTVHTYDFSTGAGSDKWAYRRQASVKPPGTNDVPSTEFTTAEYGRIESNNNVFQEDITDAGSYYSTHRFTLKIQEDISSITSIYVLWNGKGYTESSGSGAIDGATLYIWNSANGEYENKNTTTTSSEVDLSYNITSGIGNYIDADGNLRILVEQNTYTRWKQGAYRYSHIQTDYVKADVSGVYPKLDVSIDEYPDVTRGDTGISYKAYVNNTGETDATDTWLNWTLPSGWINQTGNLNKSIGILGPGNTAWNNITVSVQITAAPGPQTITASAICAENLSDSDTKTVTVKAPTNITQVDINNSYPIAEDIVQIKALLKYDNESAIANQDVSFYYNTSYINSALTNASGWAIIDWDTTGVAAGDYWINATYAGNSTIYTLTSYNSTQQVSVSTGNYTVTIQTDEDEYRVNEIVTISGAVTNQTGVDNAAVNLSVYYPNKTLSKLINTSTDANGDYTAYYDLSYPIGTYTIKVNASKGDDWGVNSTTFLAVGLLTTVSTDKPSYIAGQSVAITVNAEYNNGTASNNSLVNLTVKDPGGIVINETSGYTDVSGYFYYQCNLSTNAATGTYTVIANVTDAVETQSNSTTFEVTQKSASFDIAPSVTFIYQGGSIEVSLTVDNNGVVNISGSLNITTTEPYFTIENETSKDYVNLTPGNAYTCKFNVTAGTTTPTQIFKLNATCTFDGEYRQKDVVVRVIKEPGIFIRAVTNTSVVLLDPYYWVDEAPNNLWPDTGHPRSVTINAMVVDRYGRPVPNEKYPDEPYVTYEVINETAIIIAQGMMDKARKGFYETTFEINESAIGNADYSSLSNHDDFIIYVNASELGKEVSGTTSLKAGRWTCDYQGGTGTTCHYPDGHHTWGTWGSGDKGGVLGGACQDPDFDIRVLTDGNWTHGSPYLKDNNGVHETVTYLAGSGCDSGSPCHTATVTCTKCHTNILQGEHTQVAAPDATWPNCANSSCHGRLNVTSTEKVDKAYPNCSDCHPISYRDNFTDTSQKGTIDSVPQWLNTTTGEPKDIAIHPNPDNAVVNCSFCHNPFHNLYDESDVLTCGDCHNESNDYSIHNGTYPSASYEHSANCTDCHNFSATLQIDIHNTITPACSLCHDEVNHSSYNTYGVSCLQCHNDHELAYSGDVLMNGTYMANTSIHSENNLIPNCSDCHLDYSNHSSYATDGVYCTYCHNNATLDYSSARNLLVNDTGIYNTTYNTDTAIHTMTSSEMIPNCTDCHGSGEYKTHLGDATEVAAGTAANCTQCHDNVSLTYNSSGTVLSPGTSYNTNGEIHTMTRDEMLPNQTANLNDSCAVCHVTVYNETTRTHSNNNACYKCHFDPDVQYQGTIQDRPVEHTTNETIGCRACHFNYTRVADIIGKPRYFVNETMFNASVHGNQSAIDCRDCHTKYHRPPEYTWKWCECCHSYQADPVNETDRHNVTADPLSYRVNVGGTMTPVLNITDCTTCHDATQYNTARDTFNRTKNCRYCHTYPDQTYY